MSVAGPRRLIEAAILLAVVALALRVFTFDTVRRLLRTHTRLPIRASVREIVTAVERAGRWSPGATCLVEALVAERMLARGGHDTVMRLGVRRSPSGALDAHAWLECGSAVVLGASPNVTDYARLS